ncbi:Ras-related protein Rab-34-like 2 [Homarus americanus]|uniref:Ras-related protein Rab-36 n=1 Tax=Homarus americanus TaxID=6706 RepID=A0A8J5TIP1_HOMAM|nr:Ras-related protein Rab-34-like 2 [Homarus americanus]
MQLSRSAVYTMLQTHAEKDRIIISLPPPFIRQASPHTNDDFDESVKNAALLNIDLSSRLCHQVFDANYKATIGVDFEVERFDILGIPFNLQIWDTAGQERFKCIAASYYRGAHAVMVVFDVTNIVTLAHTAQWLEEARQANLNSNPLVFLVGTKRDLMSEGAYNQIEAQAKRVAQGLGAEYWAVSSKTGDNVEALFLRVAALTFNRAVLQEVQGYDLQKFGDSFKIGEKLDNASEARKKSKCAACGK